jgi:hypothetical protein
LLGPIRCHDGQLRALADDTPLIYLATPKPKIHTGTHTRTFHVMRPLMSDVILSRSLRRHLIGHWDPKYFMSTRTPRSVFSCLPSAKKIAMRSILDRLG